MTSTTSEAAEARSHSILSEAGSAADRLDQALEADQQQRQVREAVFRRRLGYTHHLRMVGYELSMFWLPSLVPVIGLGVALGNSGGFDSLLNLLLFAELSVPLWVPSFVLAARVAEKLLLKRAKAEALEIERVERIEPMDPVVDDVRREATPQQQIDGEFSNECACARFCVGAVSAIPISVLVMLALNLIDSHLDLPLMEIFGVLFFAVYALGAMVYLVMTGLGLFSFRRRRALIKEARRKGLTVRDPAASPWS